MTEMSPVFVFGALRSGTTVFRLMLNAHEGIYNPGEIDFLFDFIAPDESAPGGWRYDLDAMRNNRIFRAHELDIPLGMDGTDLLARFIAQFQSRAGGRLLTMNAHRHADRIVGLLPGSRFVHLLRDPRDVARSCVGMGWAGISYFGVRHWIATERDWDGACVAPDRTLTLKFEELMADPAGRLAEVCAFLGKSYSDRMLTYYENTTYAAPNPGLVNQWRKKASEHEIALIEGRLGELLVARGYESHTTPVVPGPLEKAWLTALNGARRRRASIRRFGFGTLLGARLSRIAGATEAHARYRRRMDDKIAKSLK